MVKLSILAALAVPPFLLIGCVSATQTNSAQKEGEIVAISPALRAEIIRQGEDSDEEVCIRKPQMGSTIPREVCAFRAAWEAKRQASREYLEQNQKNGLRTRAGGS